MLDKIEFVLSEAFLALRRNTWMTFAAVTTAAMALFIFGGLGLTYLAIVRFAEQVGDRFEMSVFLKESTPGAKIPALEKQIAKIPGVKSVKFNSKADVLKRFKALHPDIDLQGLDAQAAMPNEFEVSFSDLKLADDVVDKVSAMAEVEQVRYLREEQNFLEQSLGAIRWLGIVLGGLLLVTSGVLIYNTIRLTIVARRREIRIMQLVGATRLMVWTPMLIEGVIQGIIGGLLATFVLWSATAIVQALMASITALQARGPFPLGTVMLWLVAIGAAYGLLCSLIAVREPRRRFAG